MKRILSALALIALALFALAPKAAFAQAASLPYYVVVSDCATLTYSAGSTKPQYVDATGKACAAAAAAATGATAANQTLANTKLDTLHTDMLARPGAATAADGSTTQTAGGTAQALFSGATPANGWKVAIPAASPGAVCWVSDTTTTPSATTAGSYPAFAQGQYATEPGERPSGPVYVNCPTTGMPISAKRW